MKLPQMEIVFNLQGYYYPVTAKLASVSVPSAESFCAQ